MRAYKGQAPALIPYKDVLTAALTIHSVEARHAAEVRRLRGNFTDAEPFFEGWITLNQTDVPGVQRPMPAKKTSRSSASTSRA